MKFKPSRSFLFSLVILFTIGAGYWWSTSGHASWRVSRAQHLRAAMLRDVFGPDLPVSVSHTSRSETSDTATPTIEGRLSRQEFNRLLDRTKWKEIPIPNDYLSTMHLPPDTPRDYMTCFSGQINRRPAKLFWSDYAETFMLGVDK